MPGRVAFTPYTLGLRFLTRRELVIDITAVNWGSGHRAERRQIWSVSPSARGVEVQTAQALLEWAVLPEVAEAAMDLVDPAFGCSTSASPAGARHRDVARTAG
ncbi:hypothetical protein GCM10027519_33800 [Kineococcus endophyticus]